MSWRDFAFTVLGANAVLFFAHAAMGSWLALLHAFCAVSLYCAWKAK